MISQESQDLKTLTKHILTAYQRMSHLLRNSSEGKEMDSKNCFGDIQLDTDLQSDEIFFQELKHSGLVAYGLSEEKPSPIALGGTKFIVTFDPLDGSSIIGTNWTVGSIVGIWPNDEGILIGKRVKDQISASCCLYGPRTTALVINQEAKGVDELTLKLHEGVEEWKATKHNLNIKKTSKLFAPGNLRAASDEPGYKECIKYWFEKGYTLRYTGGMVPDIYQMFIKGDGIFCNIASKKHPAKLRLLYEIAPLTFLVKAAGGAASDGTQDLMEEEVKSYDQRGLIIVGSEAEVERIVTNLKTNNEK